jgi:hypothetical protein
MRNYCECFFYFPGEIQLNVRGKKKNQKRKKLFNEFDDELHGFFLFNLNFFNLFCETG